MIPTYIPRKINIPGSKVETVLKKEESLINQEIVCLGYLDLTQKVKYNN